MLEIIMLIAMCVAMYRIADNDDQRPWLWAGVALLLGLASLAIPLPFLRVGLAAVVAFVGMIAYKVISER